MPKIPDQIQQQVIEARRNQILDAASHIFAEKGFHRATIKDIAAYAEIADGTIYNYFKNKTELLTALLDRMNETDQRVAHFDEAALSDFRSFFVAYLRHRIELLWSNHEVFKAILPELLTNAELRDTYYQGIVLPSLKIAEQFFGAQMEAGKIQEMDIPLTARTFAATILGLLVLQLLGDEEIEARWQELPDVIANLILNEFERK